MSREYCMFVLEGGSGTTPYCTPVAPAASANIWTTAATTGIPSTASGANNYAGFYARLDGGDSFTMRPRPVPVTVPYGGGFAIPAFTVSDKQMLEGTYKTKLYAGAFTQMLLQLACQQVNSLGYVGVSGVTRVGSMGQPPDRPGTSAETCRASRSSTRFSGRMEPTSIGSTTACECKSWNFTLSENSTIGDLTLQLTGAYAAGNPFAYLNSVDPTAQTYAVPATVPVFNTT